MYRFLEAGAGEIGKIILPVIVGMFLTVFSIIHTFFTMVSVKSRVLLWVAERNSYVLSRCGRIGYVCAAFAIYGHMDLYSRI